MFRKIISWVRREASSLEAVFHSTVNNIHNELDRLTGLAEAAEAKSNSLMEKAVALKVASAEHSALAVMARQVVAGVRGRL